MDCKNSIIKKLKQFLVTQKGFNLSGKGVQKTLKDEKDFIVSDNAYIMMYKGYLYEGNWRYFYDLIADNYRSEIEENFEDWLSLSESEIDWLHEPLEDGDDLTGFEVISEWIGDYVDTACDTCAVDSVAGRIIREYLDSEKIA